MQFLIAFLAGGLICTAGQLLIDLTKLTPAKILVAFVVSGVVLEALGLYGPLVETAGCGATVPLTGFGYTLAKGTREIISRDGWLGIFTGPLTSGSAGITAAILCGFTAALFVRSGTK